MKYIKSAVWNVSRTSNLNFKAFQNLYAIMQTFLTNSSIHTYILNAFVGIINTVWILCQNVVLFSVGLAVNGQWLCLL